MTAAGPAAVLADRNLVVVDGFVSVSVCRRMLDEASAGEWGPSGVAPLPGREAGPASYGSGRSSSTLVVERYSAWMTAALARIEDRLRACFGVRSGRLEPWQVTRYRRGDAFDFHLDCGSWRRHPSGERRRTVLIYLEQPASGGATYFRALRTGIRPVPGRLVIWNNLLPDGHCNHAMVHAGRPVRRGRKTILTTWERERRYVPS